MKATALVYSSHNRCEYIHRWWIVQRALEGNKKILYLPISEGVRNGDEYGAQEYGYGKFRWYLDHYRQWGLEHGAFYWNDGLSRQDVEALWEMMNTYEVVILGGGNSELGMQRYQELGAHFFGDSEIASRILHHRQDRGLLTVGYSAGADQLCEYFGHVLSSNGDSKGFGLARNIVTTLHHEWGREGELIHGARNLRHCAWFGLPNDSGLAVDQGYLPSGNIYQLIEILIDNSWDLPNDAHHIKTRQGMKVDHFYADGRNWSFNGGDMMVRVMAPDNHWQDAWIVAGGRIFDYGSQSPSGYGSIGEILARH